MSRYLNQFGQVVHTNLSLVCRACFNGKRHACKKVARPAKLPDLGHCECEVCAAVRRADRQTRD